MHNAELKHQKNPNSNMIMILLILTNILIPRKTCESFYQQKIKISFANFKVEPINAIETFFQSAAIL